MFIVGLLLFGYSARLSYNSLFYYLCGITIGVSASFVIILLLISRLIPKVSAPVRYVVFFFFNKFFFYLLEKVNGGIFRSKLNDESLCHSNVNRESQYDLDIVL